MALPYGSYTHMHQVAWLCNFNRKFPIYLNRCRWHKQHNVVHDFLCICNFKTHTHACFKLHGYVISIENFLSFQIAAAGTSNIMYCMTSCVNATLRFKHTHRHQVAWLHNFNRKFPIFSNYCH
jgi:hypothetical protein